jgi:HK97 family phage major capsid protein
LTDQQQGKPPEKDIYTQGKNTMSWKVIKELKENRAKAFANAQTLRDTAAKENRDLSTEEETRHAALITEVESYGKRIEREEKVNALGENIAENRSMIGRDNSVDMPNKDFARYSLLRAINRRVNNQPLDGIELEVSQEIAKRTGKNPQGFYVPMEKAYSNRTPLNTTTGTGAVGVSLETDTIELLRNKLVINGLGARIMANMQGKFSLPRQSGGATAYWLAESGAPTVSNQTLDQVAFTPKTVGAFTDISRQFINQSSVDAESFVREDLAQTLARAIDFAALAGATGGDNPVGILYTSGVGAVTHGTNGSAETWPKIVEYETDVLGANIDPSSKLSYVTNSKVSGSLKTVDKTSGGYGQFILGSDGKLNGYNAAITNAMPSNLTKGSSSGVCSSMIFGNFDDLIVAMWGGLDILVDPYTGSTSGTIRIVALQDCDVEVRHAASFAVSKDILTA